MKKKLSNQFHQGNHCGIKLDTMSGAGAPFLIRQSLVVSSWCACFKSRVVWHWVKNLTLHFACSLVTVTGSRVWGMKRRIFHSPYSTESSPYFNILPRGWDWREWMTEVATFIIYTICVSSGGGVCIPLPNTTPWERLRENNRWNGRVRAWLEGSRMHSQPSSNHSSQFISCLAGQLLFSTLSVSSQPSNIFTILALSIDFALPSIPKISSFQHIFVPCHNSAAYRNPCFIIPIF